LSIGAVQAGAAQNVIPAEVYVNGTIRSFDPDVREKLWAETENAFKLAKAMGGLYELSVLPIGTAVLAETARRFVLGKLD